MKQADFEAALEALRQEYRQNLPVRVGEVQAIWEQLRDRTWDAAQFQTLTRLTHSLAGSGATYGFAAVSHAARALELYCKELNGTEPAFEARTEIEHLFAQLKQMVAALVEPAPPAPVAAQTAAAPPTAHFSKQVILYEPNAETARELQAQLETFDYGVTRLERLDALAEPCPTPAAVILNWDAAQQESDAQLALLAALHRARPVLPILFLSKRDDLLAHLDAVRHGATAYLTMPLSTDSLLEKLDAQTGNRSSEPYRVLIVEDDASLAQWSATVLNNAGMSTCLVTDPLQVMAPLIDFRPDLILSDMHMPHLNGLELAAMLRQQEAYVGIPIVFLSSETDLNTQLSAMLLGGDDFLLKPIAPHHLVASVTSRVQRARALRSLAERDSLTGLLNHTRFKERLGAEVARAVRTASLLAFVMLDIDRFKAVNDTYGHPAGDRVLKTLARFLKQRLRKSDILGRYGGEEFAIILPETDAAAAFEVIDEIRAAFAQLRQYSAEREFQVTFSGGIAMLTPGLSVQALSEAADKALYRAKRGGRNQIVVAE